MDILVFRDTFEEATLGKLFVDGTYCCETLEDRDRKLESGGVKVPAQTAIPRGTYELIVNTSAHFDRRLPLLVAVPEFEGVRIHSGNMVADTEGCILVGLGRTATSVTSSRAAFSILFDLIDRAYMADKQITIEVR